MTKKKDNILSIEHDDDNKDYDSFVEHLKEDVDRRKSRLQSDIEENGEIYLLEIEQKKIRNEPIKKEYIQYILKKTKNKYSEKLLNAYSFEDVKDIYDELKSKKSIMRKIFKFFYL